jgi:hypothetical protein
MFHALASLGYGGALSGAQPHTNIQPHVLHRPNMAKKGRDRDMVATLKQVVATS